MVVVANLEPSTRKLKALNTKPAIPKLVPGTVPGLLGWGLAWPWSLCAAAYGALTLPGWGLPCLPPCLGPPV